MNINRDNYETYFLDYLEGQLSPEMAEEVIIFVEQNPDLKDVLEEFEAVSLVADQDIVFEKKAFLKKNQIFATSQVNELNYEEYLIGETEGLLNAEQLASVEEFISINPQFEKDRRLFALAHLSAEDKIIFEAKESLKQKAIPVGTINADTHEIYMSRELEGDLDKDETLQFAEFMQYNPHLEKERKLYKYTILSTETDIIFKDKNSLKQTTAPIRRIVYYALSAAASLALIFSVYFLLDRNDIPRTVAENGKVKNAINKTISEPASENTGKQTAQTIKQPATVVSFPDQQTNPIAISTTTGNNTSMSPESVAIVDHRTVESLQPKSSAEVTTPSYVDPQFTFIRSSQMHINKNLEFYYNLKLAEQIQFAQINSSDKNPGKTIYNATIGKIGGLFASNRPTQPKEDSKSITLWTFAELGIQTFNTVTSSELELKLEKDDEGKVVAYGLEGGLIDFGREVKK